MKNLGKEGKDKITGFKGIIVGKAYYLFGCATYALAPQSFDSTTGKRPDTEWFDEGRIEIVSDGIKAEQVSVELPGNEFNFDQPKI